MFFSRSLDLRCSAGLSAADTILFILYTADLVTLVLKFGLSPHLYADDTQISHRLEFKNSKIISQLVTLKFSPKSKDPNITDLLHREPPPRPKKWPE